MVGAIAAITLVLGFLPGRARIPPEVGSDYTYLFTAADRLYEGEGATAAVPYAPCQPWEWQRDWGFLHASCPRD